GATPVTIVNNSGRVFNFTSSSLTAVTLQDLTITGTASDGSFGGAVRSGVGSGSFTLTIDSCTLTGTNSANAGGALRCWVADIVNISNSTLVGQVTTVSGNANLTRGGALIAGTGTTTLTNCTIANSSTTGSGGGIAVFGGTVNLINCTIADNTAAIDGG